MAIQIRLADIVVDCAEEQALCSFYVGLLGWHKTELFGHPGGHEPGWRHHAALCAGRGLCAPGLAGGGGTAAKASAL